ncbi:FAD-binding domain-containing protein [Ophiobolus disseminans]|uniref:FAD-binding domain-containing protein n=1 Tax=Ophiobolus disseminans TaxID=1469910 RepID=A0A6A7AHF6_9PLEO|nr:FAD-binding domain-containing protein [Ophiobolus disseminans]
MAALFLQLLSILPFLVVLSSAAPLDATSSPVIQVFDALQRSDAGLSPQTLITLRGSNGSAPATIQRWTLHDAPTFALYTRPATAADVRIIVRTATQYQAPLLAIGGSHGFSSTLGKLDDGIALDLSALKQVKVDTSANTVIVGGSVTFGELLAPVAAAGREIQTGLLPCVGAVGATLGGGIGRYAGLHGLVLDALQSVRLVTATGDLVTVSRTSNPELFWGLRGAGFNFGIVVEAVYAVYPVTAPQVMNADFLIPLSQSAAVVRFFKLYESKMPAELSIVAAVANSPQFGGAAILLNIVYVGALEVGSTYIQSLLDTTKPTLHNVTSIPWDQVSTKSFFASATSSCVRGANRNVYGAGVRNIDVPTFDDFFAKIGSFYQQYPGAAGTVFFIERFATQAVQVVSDDTTAYPHRDINTHLLFNYAYEDPSLESDVNKFAKELRQSFDSASGFDTPKVYVNYGHGDESQETLFGQRKLTRLRALKKRFDSRGVFSFYHPL